MTKYIVDRLIGEFEKHGVIADCFKIEEAAIRDFSLAGYDAFGIAYPVHSFNAPKIVVDFAKRLPETNGLDTFIIHSAGADSVSNYASSDLLIRKLLKKGYNVFYNKLIGMPSNFAAKYDDDKVRGILDKANENIPHIAKEIIALTPGSMQKNFSSRLIALIGRSEWFGAHIAGKLYYVKSDCNRCGMCAENCPNKNIAMSDKSVDFNWRCGWCMRCVYTCPQNAVYIRWPLKFIRFDKWYDSELFK